MIEHSRLLFRIVAAVLVATGTVGCSKPTEVSAISPVASPAAPNVSDIDITEHVKTVLHQTASLNGADITVVTSKGDVRLTGVLDTQAQIDEAIRIARAAEGAHTIHDELTIKK
ncbi:MAG: BON domain-containing protein [Burkholderiales bacterium]